MASAGIFAECYYLRHKGSVALLSFLVGCVVECLLIPSFSYLGVSENRGSEYSALNSRILIISTPKIRYP